MSEMDINVPTAEVLLEAFKLGVVDAPAVRKKFAEFGFISTEYKHDEDESLPLGGLVPGLDDVDAEDSSNPIPPPPVVKPSVEVTGDVSPQTQSAMKAATPKPNPLDPSNFDNGE